MFDVLYTCLRGHYRQCSVMLPHITSSCVAVVAQEMMRDQHLAPLVRIGEDLYDAIEELNVHHPSGMSLGPAALYVADLLFTVTGMVYKA